MTAPVSPEPTRDERPAALLDREELLAEIVVLRSAIALLLDCPVHDTYEGRAGRTKITHHREGCEACHARRIARAALAECVVAR